MSFEVAAVEVVREGRFTYRVHLRIPDGIGMTIEPPCMFRWTAERQARKVAEQERRDGERQVVSRIHLDIEREIGGWG